MSKGDFKNDDMSIKNTQNYNQLNKLPTSKKTLAMLPLKKLTLLKSVPTTKGGLSPEKISSIGLVKGEVYQKRKQMLPEYKDLFAALLRLPDKEVQKKLLDVINNHKPVEYRNVETQTDFTEHISSKSIKDEEISTSSTASANSVNLGIHKTLNGSKVANGVDATPTDVPKKRKRKRKVSLPQANKESRAKQVVKMNRPKAIANDNNLPRSQSSVTSNGIKRQRMESTFSECSSDVANICEDFVTNPSTEFQKWNICLENGLLPIQDAVVRNQISKLQVHIKIWKFIKWDLNDLVTDEDEDLLQLAILNCCEHNIVNVLLEHGLNPNCLDAESNTIVHLAILNDVDFNSMEHLMKRIDLKLLLTLNDEGYTPLHLAVRQDRFLLAECLINVLDERLTKKVIYKLKFDELETDEARLTKQFKDYYEKICLKMSADEESNSFIVSNHELKQQLLQTGDRRSGNIALYFAIDSKYDHLIYFLLAHLTDPRTENLSGQDCKTFFSEYGKSLNLSLNIDNTMEKVIKLLS
ncbi:hypothetical protein DOY81_000420 [Sarcophaga bullata]|nr:hypothetical protein DOY81_000420 [Sarcophaga bullata]